MKFDSALWWTQLLMFWIISFISYKRGKREGTQLGVEAGIEIGMTFEKEHINIEDVNDLTVNNIPIKLDWKPWKKEDLK